MKKQTKINILANTSIDNFVIEDLYGKEKIVKNNTSILLNYSWYLLKISCNKNKFVVDSISIDGSSLGKFIETGYFDKKTNEFNIWIHPNLGYMIATLMDQIEPGDLKQKILAKKYMLTVDRPLKIGKKFPVHIQGFFSHGSGPKWWNKQKRPLPYILIEDPEIKEMVSKIEILEKHLDTQADFSGKESQTLLYNDQWIGEGWKMESYSSATAKDYDAESFSGFGAYFKKLGFKQLYQVYTAYLGPQGYVNLHTDGSQLRKKQNEGNTRFYCSYSNTDQVYFKMAGVGLLPMDTPMLIDPGNFVHSVVNLSKTNFRKSLIITGVF